MEPLDPSRNEGSGFSRRRISSILKAPRKSVRLPDPEQQENVAECPKPGEKRNSRRVSFAPANDVLLFSKDVKNDSSSRSPLQELMSATAADTQNRVQFAVSDEGIQQITGMETLLKAPLHAGQQKEMFNFDAGVDFGEKTVMFSDDAIMDMTQSHTINIANDADISLDNYNILPTGGENLAVGPISRSVDLGAEKKNKSSSGPSIDPGFQDFLASLSKPSHPSINPAITRTTPPAGTSSEDSNSSLSQIKTQQAYVDKENLAPASVMEKMLNVSRKSLGGALYPDGNDSMDMTEAQTGRIQAFTDEDKDDPFKCLFPSQEMYAEKEEASKQQQQCWKTLPASYSKDISSMRGPSLRASLPGLQFNPKDDHREKTIMFTAGEDFMDMTQSHTINISSGSIPAANKKQVLPQLFQSSKKTDINSSLKERKTEGSSTHAVNLGFKDFLASLSKQITPSSNTLKARTDHPATAASRSFEESLRGGNDVSMDMTTAQTGQISGPAASEGPFQFVFPSKDVLPQSDGLKSAEKNRNPQRSSNHTGMATYLKPSLKTKTPGRQVKFDSEDDCRERTVRFSADDACMDVTKSHTVNIINELGLQSNQSLDIPPDFGEKTVRFAADDAAMEMTQSHTVNIAAGLELQSLQNSELVPACGEKTVRFSANDAAMDMTQCLTVNIASSAASESLLPIKSRHTRSRSSSAHGVDPGFQKDRPAVGRETLPAAQSSDIRETFNRVTVSQEEDVCMDMTEAQTGRILVTEDHLHLLKKSGMNSRQSADPKGLKSSLTASGKTKGQTHQVNFDSEDDCREKTVRFSADDACMDVTRSHTVQIASDAVETPRLNANYPPAYGEKTLRFNAADAAMDETRSHTVNIAANLEPETRDKIDFLPSCGEKTVRFSADDAAMDVTRSHTVNIAMNLEPNLHNKVNPLSLCGEKTLRFSADDAAMDVTRSHTVNIATGFGPQSHQNTDVLPACRDATLCFSADDAAMEETRCLTVDIGNISASDSDLPNQDINISSNDFHSSAKLRESESYHLRRNRSSSAQHLDSGRKDFPETNNLLVTKSAPDVETEAPSLASSAAEERGKETIIQDDLDMDMTEAKTGHILRETCTDEPLLASSSTQGMNSESEHLKDMEQKSEAPTLSNRPDSVDSNESEIWKEVEPRNQTSVSPKRSSPSANDPDRDTAPSRKSRRMSLADLHSKVKRLSHLINRPPDSSMPQDMDKNLEDETKFEPLGEPVIEIGQKHEENAQAEGQTEEEEEEKPLTATPFNLKTKHLMSRLSVGGFKAKLPQRNKLGTPKEPRLVSEPTRTMTFSITSQLTSLDADVSDINDEELGSLEDMSETIDTRTPQKTSDEIGRFGEFNGEALFEDDVFEQDFIHAVCGKKRPLSSDEDHMEDNEKRRRASTDTAADVDMGFQAHVDVAVECEANVDTLRSTDYSNSSHTASMRCEATFESTFKQSLFESQLEDYASDVQRKFDDGTITVQEFFKLFNIDFVIHNPRQSVLPPRLSSDTVRTPMDLLRERHIYYTKQLVYEANVQDLTETVEGLKVRMRDLDKPLLMVNRSLWEDMRNFSEAELKSFGAKLKERNNWFRKTSKVQSHEMKEVLYSRLVQATLEEQQKLIGRMEEADGMIQSLDHCIQELETEIDIIEEKGSEDEPSLKSCQEELKKVTEGLADSDRQISELEMQKAQNSSKLNRLRAETRNQESLTTMLNMVNEWRVGEKRENHTVYTFLHDTFHLQVLFEKPKGNNSENQSEKKISQIKFKLQLDDEKSEDQACLVHKLLSQYISGETDWVEKYPTSTSVPALLHDVGLVVSRCRLLGEELRRLKLWGALRLDILHISCTDTQVHLVFSSLRKLTKFEVIFCISLHNHAYVLQLQSFQNVIGNTTIQQIEEIAASFSPTKNLLTKTVKKIHEALLR